MNDPESSLAAENVRVVPVGMAPAPSSLVDLRSVSQIREQDMLRAKWALWKRFQAWQAAVTMNAVFGKGYIEVPDLPEGYETYADNWAANNGFKL